MANLTMLEKYQRMFADLTAQPVPLERARTFQELAYRLEALQVCQMYCANAPVGTDVRAMFGHYRMVDEYLENLKNERNCGSPHSDDELKQRETAQENLARIVADYRKRFSSFQVSEPGQYKAEIVRAITTFLPAWLQKRNAYMKINSKENE